MLTIASDTDIFFALADEREQFDRLSNAQSRFVMISAGGHSAAFTAEGAQLIRDWLSTATGRTRVFAAR